MGSPKHLVHATKFLNFLFRDLGDTQNTCKYLLRVRLAWPESIREYSDLRQSDCVSSRGPIAQSVEKELVALRERNMKFSREIRLTPEIETVL
jgi:hypothetical protein